MTKLVNDVEYMTGKLLNILERIMFFMLMISVGISFTPLNLHFDSELLRFAIFYCGIKIYNLSK